MPDSMVALRNQRLFDMGLDAEQGIDDGPVMADATMKVMFHCDRITQAQVDETRYLFEKYRPIEMDPNLTLEQKKEYMHEWWTENLKMYASLNLTETDFQLMLAKSKMACRHGIIELL